jgi:hypothetical protein
VNRPRNAKELFNLRHSSLRNAIERIFGVVKKRFPILKKQLEYDYVVQVQLVNALCCLHNFIRREGRLNGEEDMFGMLDDDELQAESNPSEDGGDAPARHRDVSDREKRMAKTMRDKIAQDMWNQHITRQ